MQVRFLFLYHNYVFFDIQEEQEVRKTVRKLLKMLYNFASDVGIVSSFKSIELKLIQNLIQIFIEAILYFKVLSFQLHLISF